jgi:hypothetical protein
MYHLIIHFVLFYVILEGKVPVFNYLVSHLNPISKQ